ncbi:MAG: ATP-binding protein, partial [Candidatus Omnitrophota bacterium]
MAVALTYALVVPDPASFQARKGDIVPIAPPSQEWRQATKETLAPPLAVDPSCRIVNGFREPISFPLDVPKTRRKDEFDETFIQATSIARVHEPADPFSHKVSFRYVLQELLGNSFDAIIDREKEIEKGKIFFEVFWDGLDVVFRITDNGKTVEFNELGNLLIRDRDENKQIGEGVIGCVTIANGVREMGGSVVWCALAEGTRVEIRLPASSPLPGFHINEDEYIVIEDEKEAFSRDEGENIKKTPLHERWIEIELSALIAQAIQMQISRHTLIPLINGRMQSAGSAGSDLKEKFSIDGIEEVHDASGRITAFRLPRVTEGNSPRQEYVYRLDKGAAADIVIPLKGGTVYVEKRNVEEDASSDFAHDLENMDLQHFAADGTRQDPISDKSSRRGFFRRAYMIAGYLSGDAFDNLDMIGPVHFVFDSITNAKRGHYGYSLAKDARFSEIYTAAEKLGNDLWILDGLQDVREQFLQKNLKSRETLLEVSTLLEKLNAFITVYKASLDMFFSEIDSHPKKNTRTFSEDTFESFRMAVIACNGFIQDENYVRKTVKLKGMLKELLAKDNVWTLTSGTPVLISEKGLAVKASPYLLSVAINYLVEYTDNMYVRKGKRGKVGINAFRDGGSAVIRIHCEINASSEHEKSLALPGLAKTIVRDHGGEIKIMSDPVEGTDITIRLPLVKNGPDAPDWLENMDLQHFAARGMSWREFERLRSRKDDPIDVVTLWSEATMTELFGCLPRDLKGKNILIPGCGGGAVCFRAALEGADRVVGLDIDENSITVAKMIAPFIHDPLLRENLVVPNPAVEWNAVRQVA